MVRCLKACSLPIQCYKSVKSFGRVVHRASDWEGAMCFKEWERMFISGVYFEDVVREIIRKKKRDLYIAIMNLENHMAGLTEMHFGRH